MESGLHENCVRMMVKLALKVDNTDMQLREEGLT